MSNRRATGRLRAINRADLAHGDVALIGSDLLGEAPSAGAIRDTENHGLATDTKRANRNRLKKMMDWWKTNLPEYYAVAVRDLTEDELRMVRAMKKIKHASEHPAELLTMAVKSLWEGKEAPKAYLERLGLADAHSFRAASQ